ncbi:transcriptional regulator [Burkholderia pseudomallei]|nr:transcriptional regulator [Burkholderia pseudomallei]
MKSDSAIFSFIENFPTSASLKTADTGKYIANNIHNSIQFGIKNPKDLTCLISSGHFNLGERPRLLQLNNTAA